MEYKITLLKLSKFIILFLIIDFALGSITKQLFFQQKTGKYARSIYAIRESNAKIMIFGSSHAHRHYVPEIFEKELKTSCYNNGAEGQQLLFHLAMQRMILRNKKPDIMILNIDENFLFKSDIAYDRLADLYPYYEDYKDELESILSLKSKLLNFQLFFKAYQSNSTIVHVIRYFLSPQIDTNGYRPLYGKINPSKDQQHDDVFEKEYIEEIDENFVNSFTEFIYNARKNNVKLIFVTSPTFYEVDLSKNLSYNMMVELSEKENIQFLDFFNDEEFYGKEELFHDKSHLNDTGARIFTKKIIEKINTK
ncbi:hypothetical protein ABW636_07995 [Aquimarina sp. 2201CG1-2-11]|uniref:hypothetical protein n=1 Tax=Aquimarina discodermiae TaxID=3231043 RepID=UPI003462094F